MPQKQKVIIGARKNALILTLILCFPLLTGCVKIQTGKERGGVFKSFDKAETWESKIFVSQVKKKKITIANVDAVNIVLNPQDSNFIFLGTKKDGLYLSLDGGEKWSPSFNKKVKIDSMAFDYQSSAIAYFSSSGKIYKSADQSKSWEQVYLEANQKIINSLAVDPKDSKTIYAGLSDGRLLRSADYGKSWQTINDFQNGINQILINKNNQKIIYIGTKSKGIYKTSDKGVSWQDLTKDLKFSGGKKFKIAVFDYLKDDALIAATKYGLLKTDDGGKTWEEIKLLSLPGKIDILSLAVNPFNSNEIYYGSKEAIFKTDDGGKTWKTILLPSNRAPVSLVIDPFNPDLLYLGVAKIEK